MTTEYVNDKIVKCRTSRVDYEISKVEVYGMNLIIANHVFKSEESSKNMMPYMKMFDNLLEDYEILCIIGYPAIHNLYSECLRYGNMEPYEKMIKYLENSDKIRVSTWGGDFYDGMAFSKTSGGDEYDSVNHGGQSDIVKLIDISMLCVFMELFPLCDALAFLLFRDIKYDYDGLLAELSLFDNHNSTVNNILKYASGVIMTCGDMQYGNL